MAAGDPVDKDSKISRFITRVVNPAVATIQRDQTTALANLKGSHPLELGSQFAVSPDSFNKVSVSGGKLTVSAMVDLFQFYAYNLTSIRRSNMRMASALNTNSASYSAVWSNLVSALGPSYRMNIATFRSYVAGGGGYSGNVLTPFSSGNIATEADVDALIERLRSIVLANASSSSVISVDYCHSACHSNCHSSRGRR